MYSTDLMTTEFDSFLDKNYSDKYEKLESELTVLKMQYQLNLKIHSSEKKDLKGQMKRLETIVKDNSKMIRDLELDRSELTQKLERQKLDPGQIGMKCFDIESDLRKLQTNLDFIQMEKTTQRHTIDIEFTSLLRLCKRENFFSKEQSTQTELTFSASATKGMKFNLPDYLDDLNTLANAYSNPLLQYLSTDARLIDKDFCRDRLPLLTNRICLSFFKSENPIGSVHVILDELVKNAGYTNTIKLMTNLHNTINGGSSPLHEYKLISRLLCIEDSGHRQTPIGSGEFKILRQVWDIVFGEITSGFSHNDEQLANLKICEKTISYDFISNKILESNRLFGKKGFKTSLRKFFRKIILKKFTNEEIPLVEGNVKKSA
jgi:hypothetical protein